MQAIYLSVISFSRSIRTLKQTSLCILISIPLIGYTSLGQANENQWITKFAPKFKPLHNQLNVDPFSIIKSLEKINSHNSSSSLSTLQTHLLLSWSYAYLEMPDQAAIHSEIGLKTINLANQPWLYHQFSIARAYAHDRQGSPAKGFKALNEAIIWAKQYKDDAMLIRALDVRATLHISLVNYIKALKDLQYALSLAPIDLDPNSLNLPIANASLQGSLAILYEYRRENDISIPYFEEAINYHRAKNNWLMLSSSLYGLGNAHLAIGSLDRAHGLLTESKQVAEQINDYQGVAYALKEISKIHEKWKDYNQAEETASKALKIFQKANNIYMYIDVSLTLARIAIRNKNIDRAELYLSFAKSRVKKTSMPYQSIAVDEYQSQLYAVKNQFEEAYLLSLQIIKEKQHLLREQSSQELHDIRIRYELNSIDSKNQLLKKENELNKANIEAIQQNNKILILAMSSTFILLILLIFLYIRIKQHKKTLEILANTDSLTGLLNRRKSIELISKQLDLSERHQQDFCLVLVDIDWFKKINDNFGHTMGDRVLIEFSKLCKKHLRDTDIIARYGGEEFLIALPHTSIIGTENLINKLRILIKSMPKNFCCEGFDSNKMELSFSAGLTSRYAKATTSDLISQADLALYQAKNSGRDRIVIYS